ncbi:chromosome segregation ATPase [Levilactobacillus koreensis JCM 16448]|uniref:Uncharacterized protein n=1 Tax=Levilactobacillus koreensis TaxID=637971 RepID=A0AAC8UVF8_9LACO|nr:SbcC/MukB-like Walker B domain-containing protein [Levilactobacillus koreensis]AKP64449.1 hypothetical protein ABN16_05180 [Levilactobacillus koreensis]KRK92540.1 chromosome segregation ATPase [Levilactobacillus koreensis JCM 16448]
MTVRHQLTPVSFHLRNFNKYSSLDLAAAKNGNLTLIGENAAGKTTLANCFFPMLIDGSIATPSFNSAKGTDRLESTGTPRNSQRDTRNFESMLLGWGPGAMKVRTGYSYLLLQSKTRQVILGLGAHRAVGELRKPTWWFVVISDDVTDALSIVTTDADGSSLGEEAFRAANAGLGEQLHLFNQAPAYREYVATQVYGFSNGEALGKLAAVYRLLASPILTGGNARFTPIREALKNAQEGIDSQVIGRVADSQREVNRTKGVLQRLKKAEERLQRMKKEIFWRNLNHLREATLDPYSQVHQDFEGKQETVSQNQQTIGRVTQQLELMATNLTQVEDTLKGLRQEKANQNGIVQRRKEYEQQITSLQQRLLTYRKQQEQLTELRKKLATVATQQSELTTQQRGLNDQHLRPLLTKLAAQAKELPELMDVVTEVDSAKLAQRLGEYLQQFKDFRNQYDDCERAKERVSKDVQIVVEMRDELRGRIDEHAQGPLYGRVRKDIHQDNQEVHDAGATQMNGEFQRLLAKQQQLLKAHPDLKHILKSPDFLTDLRQQRRLLTDLLQKIAEGQRQLDQLTQQQQFFDQQVTDVLAAVEPDFDERHVTAEIAATQQRRDALIVDTEIDTKIKQAEAEQTQLNGEQQRLDNQRSLAEGKIATAKEDMARLTTRLDQLAKQSRAALETLAPYQPQDAQLTTITDAIEFVQENRSEVRNSSYGDISDWIGRLIHHNDSNGTDRNALDTLFEERGYADFASAMRQQRSINQNGLTVVAFDINRALLLMTTDQNHVTKSLKELTTGNDVAQDTYLTAAIQRITAQYQLIADYNRMLTEGVSREQSIKLKVELTPTEVSDQVIKEACDPLADKRPALVAEIRNRLEKLANDLTVADDDDLFMDAAQRLLDTRQWSAFKVLIKRRQSAEDNYEEVDDKFVQSGGSGAEKAQAMVLPLLLVPKMVLQRAQLKDAPYLVMFDEFADKLDPETAKSFAKTIARFGFNFIATMPSGAQNKILADRVDNIAYDVIAPQNQNDGRFHRNIIREALSWGDAHAKSVS